MLSFDKSEGKVNLKEFNEMNFAKVDKPKIVEEERDGETRELQHMIDGKLGDKLDMIQIIGAGTERVAVAFCGFDGLVGFKILDVN